MKAFRRDLQAAIQSCRYFQVKGAAIDNGLLKIELVRKIPEAMKPRRIAINGAGGNVRQLEGKAA
jgi:molecular chaperone IbpA